MPTVRDQPVLQFIRKIAVRAQFARLPDRELLERFVDAQEEEAFAALVCRHGSMVLRVCRQGLANEHDAEDAFQATFLVLSRKASSVKKQKSVGSWLFGVANHTSTNLKRNLMRRCSYERQVSQRSVADPLSMLTLREAEAIVNQELARLPETYRAPLVLCVREGLSRDEAAQQLGLRLGTLKNRLEQARKRLRVRLTARGLTLCGAFAASVFGEQMASAAIPAVLLTSTARAATSVATGRATASVVSAKVSALTEGVIKTMFSTKLRTALALFIVGSVLTCGLGALKLSALAVQQGDAKAKAKDGQKPRTDKDKLQGTWLLVSAIVEGEDRAEGVKREAQKNIFKGDEFTIQRADQPGNRPKVKYTLDPSKKPKTIDIVPGAGPDKGKTVPAIYKLEDETLTLCEGEVGKDRPTEFSSTAANRWILLVFKREQPKDEEDERQAARDALNRFNKEWKGYTNEPNLGDPRWKLKMETLVRLARAGPAAIQLLEEAAKKDSKWSASSRELAEQSLGLLGNPEWRKAIADYDLTQMDSARVGKLAPDFALKDAPGTTYRLSQFRDKKVVVVAFVLADT
jgi:RNA polymerase sigma factor (sigma-70 family)